MLKIKYLFFESSIKLKIDSSNIYGIRKAFIFQKRKLFFLFFLINIFGISLNAQVTTDKNILNPVRNSLTDKMCPGTVVFKEDFGGNLASDPAVEGGTPTGLTGAGACTASTISAILGIPISNPPTAAQFAQIEAGGFGTCLVYSGANNGIPEVIGYTYTKASPGQGQYSIRKRGGSNNGHWWQMDDHTYPNDTTRGYLIQFDAGSIESGTDQFFEKEINVCSGTRLSFSAWIANDIKDTITYNLKPNMAFILENTADNSVIAQFTTKNVGGSGQWRQFGFDFQVPDGISNIKLLINNNVTGSSDNGNDFVLDDIEIRICNAPITITGNAVSCVSNVPIIATFVNNNNITGGKFSYRWEYSTDSINWHTVNLDTSFTTINLGGTATFTDSIIESSSDAKSRYYRIVAGSPGTILTPCRMVSPIYHPTIPVGSVTFNAVPDQCIYNSSIDLSSYVSPSGGAFSGTGVTGSSFNPATAGAGKFIITYTSKNCNASRTVTVNDKPTITFSSVLDVPYDAIPFVMKTGNPPGGIYSGSGITTDSIFNPAKTGSGTFTINYTYTDKNGCQDNKTTTITVKANLIPYKFLIPNVFTPNGDGSNDVFKADSVSGIVNFEIIIFNRWGRKVYESKDPYFNWDGQGFADGIYFYVIEATDNENQKHGPMSGTVTIIR